MAAHGFSKNARGPLFNNMTAYSLSQHKLQPSAVSFVWSLVLGSFGDRTITLCYGRVIWPRRHFMAWLKAQGVKLKENLVVKSQVASAE
jgi:hypothetical protein